MRGSRENLTTGQSDGTLGAREWQRQREGGNGGECQKGGATDVARLLKRTHLDDGRPKQAKDRRRALGIKFWVPRQSPLHCSREAVQKAEAGDGDEEEGGCALGRRRSGANIAPQSIGEPHHLAAPARRRSNGGALRHGYEPLTGWAARPPGAHLRLDFSTLFATTLLFAFAFAFVFAFILLLAEGMSLAGVAEAEVAICMFGKAEVGQTSVMVKILWFLVAKLFRVERIAGFRSVANWREKLNSSEIS